VQGAAPIASDFNLVVEAGSSVSGTLADHLASENGIGSYASDAPTGEGMFTLDSTTGAFTYTANSTVGTDSIAYTVTDVADLSGTGTINVTIVESLKAPTIHLDRIWNESIALNLQTFIDGGQAPHTFTPASGQLTYGSYTIDATGLLTYTPNGDVAGVDTFSFEVTDGLGLPQSEVTSAAVITGTIIVTVWEPASASPVTLNLAPGGHTTIDLHTLATGGLAPLGFNLLSFPAQADAQLDPNTGMLTITVNDDASGTESFDFQVYFSFHNSIGLYSAADTDPYYPTGTITLNYIPPPTPTATATATSPSDPTATATAPASATATPPSDVTATATSPADPTATATSPAGLVATATSPGSGGDPAGGNGNGNQDGSAPATSNTGSSPGDQTGGSSGVTQLPSTGSAGERPADPSGIWMLLLLAFIIVSTAALRRHQCR